jgi:serine phosphatase RsbU (regulator of sigma subunit)
VLYFKKLNNEYAEEIEQKNEELLYKHQQLETALTDVKDSINYAKQLQDAILPPLEEINKHLPNNFIFYKPKNIVSGDFYWFEKRNDYTYIAAADCTGHGVPGALVSVVCSNALNRSIKEFGMIEPAQILNKTREVVIETLSQNNKEVKDGKDIALCAFKDNKVMYAGANNPLWIVRDTSLLSEEQKESTSSFIKNGKSLLEFKANKQPVGLHERMDDFTQQEIDLHPGDSLYLFSDGFADQFGGEKGKKFKYKPFKEFLIGMQNLSMKEQEHHISNTFDNWKGDLEQVDDVCVIGVKI